MWGGGSWCIRQIQKKKKKPLNKIYTFEKKNLVVFVFRKPGGGVGVRVQKQTCFIRTSWMGRVCD